MIALDIATGVVILRRRTSHTEKDLMDEPVSEQEFLASYHPRSFDPVATTVDVVTLTIRDDALNVLLVQRASRLRLRVGAAGRFRAVPARRGPGRRRRSGNWRRRPGSTWAGSTWSSWPPTARRAGTRGCG